MPEALIACRRSEPDVRSRALERKALLRIAATYDFRLSRMPAGFFHLEAGAAVVKAEDHAGYVIHLARSQAHRAGLRLAVWSPSAVFDKLVAAKYASEKKKCRGALVNEPCAAWSRRARRLTWWTARRVSRAARVGGRRGRQPRACRPDTRFDRPQWPSGPVAGAQPTADLDRLYWRPSARVAFVLALFSTARPARRPRAARHRLSYCGGGYATPRLDARTLLATTLSLSPTAYRSQLSSRLLIGRRCGVCRRLDIAPLRRSRVDYASVANSQLVQNRVRLSAWGSLGALGVFAVGLVSRSYRRHTDTRSVPWGHHRRLARADTRANPLRRGPAPPPAAAGQVSRTTTATSCINSLSSCRLHPGQPAGGTCHGARMRPDLMREGRIARVARLSFLSVVPVNPC